jgi:hypothetical protein
VARISSGTNSYVEKFERKMFMKLSTKIVITLSLLTLSVASWADSVTINNHSFEDDVHGDGGFTDGLISGWSFDQTDGVVGTWNPSHFQAGCGIPDQFIDAIPDGIQIAYSNGGEIFQQTGAVITEGHRYTLKVGVGGRCNFGGEDYAILMAGDIQVGATTGIQTNPVGDWDEVTVVYNSPEFDPNASGLLTVMLENLGGAQLNYDDVRLTDVEVLTCSGFYAPFDAPMNVKKKVKRALPLKFNLYDVYGNEIIDTDLANPPVVQVMMGDDTGSEIDEYDTGSDIDEYDGDLLPNGLSGDGNEFRYDPDSMQWILNLGLKAYTASGDYTVSVVAGDSSYVVEVCSETFTRQ